MQNVMRRIWPWLGFALLLVAAWAAYHPGLSGGFLFDDYVNLDALGNSGPVDNWRTFWRYITSGTADPTGRPLALLSFLIDAHNWPADPAPFLRTNLLLHLLNGALLFALLRQLGRALNPKDEQRNAASALLGAGLWLLHPLFVSTTFYIVQREAMLPATFVLLGLLAYGKGRMRFARSDGHRGIAWMVGGIVIGTTLAVLCKGNGVLLPVLAWVLEATVFRHEAGFGDSIAAQKRMGRIKFFLLILPSLFLFYYIITNAMRWNMPLGNRPWTTAERLMTEPRVVLDYLSLLVVPRSVSTGLYNDDYVVSLGLFHPASTLPALLLIVGLIVSGFCLRKRAPALAAAILFFFAGHLLESTSIALELYFEHRNYLPAMLLFWPLARALCNWKFPLAPRIGIAIVLLAICTITTYQRTELWGKPDKLAALWAIQNPDSSRAQATDAIADLNAGRNALGLQKLELLWKQRPYDLQIAFNAVNAACATRGLTDADKNALAEALRHTSTGQLLMYRWIGNVINVAAANGCHGLALDDVEHWIDASLQNPVIGNQHIRGQNIEPLLAQIAIDRQQPDRALLHFNNALEAFPTPDVAARQASALAEAGYYEQALAHLDNYERLKSRVRQHGFRMQWLHAKVLEWENYWPFEMARLRKKLHAAIAERDAGTQQPQ